MKTTQYRMRRILVMSAAAVALSACDDSATSESGSSIFVTAPVLARVPTPPQSLAVGDSVDISVLSRYAAATLFEGHSLKWTSTAAGIVSVNASGIAVGMTPGTAKIIASFLRSADTTIVTVSGSAKVATVGFAAASFSSPIGATTQLAPVARDANGVLVSGRTYTYASSAPSVATVTPGGLVTSIAAGSATLSATTGGVTGSTVLTVQAGAPPAPPPPSGSVQLPVAPQLLSFAFPSVTGKSWIVKAGDNVQLVLNQAQRGDEIVLPAGVTFQGNFVLPAKAGTAANGWVVVRSDRQASLPPQGTRVTPAHAAFMPKLRAVSVAPAIATVSGSSGWWISGVEITMDPLLGSKVHYGLVTLGDGSAKQSSLNGIPSDLVLDRTYIHGTSNGQLIRCIALNSARTAIQDSYLQDCHAKGFDSQAICAWNGPGPFKIVNNTLAGAGENIMFGGADPHITNLIPSDIEIRQNYVYTPASWKGVWTKKNLFETKNVRRLLIEGNVFDGSWLDGQVGYAFVLKVANQAGACTWCTATDITIRNNIVRNAGAGFGITGREGSSKYPVGGLLSRLLIEQNVVEQINTGKYTGDGRLISIMQDAQDVTIRSNTMTAPGALGQYLNVASIPAATNFAFQNNVVSYGSYGFFSSKYGIGENSLNAFRGSVTFSSAVMIGPPKNGYPNGTFVSSLAAGLATGMGANGSAVSLATQGVVIP